ncbi:hypothetical protein [Pyxidicoccus xibeiensis]|uniref:hypothetical protein n=1 Tax=Pyxidicoccus xibeiensis TaxID=2906759 RepID=UPI0020A7A98F|nr:hypothetical protein [Pyxidicoccus xibeiensis]MCP3139377.1 hypothetical protein [Pyxidicoccus xibeiensis]
MRKATARTRDIESESPETSALRRQLEGGLELLETASTHSQTLSTALGGMAWGRRLRYAAESLQRLLGAEPAVLEALESLRRRAQREQDASGAASRLLREHEAERERLSRLIARRLGLGEWGTLAERLKRLEALVLLMPLPPGKGESLLLAGSTELPPAGLLLRFLLALAFAAYFLGLWAAVTLQLGFIVLLWTRSGSYWLTSERLIWEPRLGLSVEVPLSALGDSAVEVSPATGNITFFGDKPLTLHHISGASRLVALLSIRRHKEFRGAAATPDPRRIISVVRARRSHPPGRTRLPDEDGQVFLRPDFVLFIPDMEARSLLETLTGAREPAIFSPWLGWEDSEASMELLIDQLQCLPEERMDALLRKVAAAGRSCVLWEPRDIDWELTGDALVLELSREGSKMSIRLAQRGGAAIRAVTAHWPGLAVSSPAPR